MHNSIRQHPVPPATQLSPTEAVQQRQSNRGSPTEAVLQGQSYRGSPQGRCLAGRCCPCPAPLPSTTGPCGRDAATAQQHSTGRKTFFLRPLHPNRSLEREAPSLGRCCRSPLPLPQSLALGERSSTHRSTTKSARQVATYSPYFPFLDTLPCCAPVSRRRT